MYLLINNQCVHPIGVNHVPRDWLHRRRSTISVPRPEQCSPSTLFNSREINVGHFFGRADTLPSPINRVNITHSGPRQRDDRIAVDVGDRYMDTRRVRAAVNKKCRDPSRSFGVYTFVKYSVYARCRNRDSGTVTTLVLWHSRW